MIERARLEGWRVAPTDIYLLLGGEFFLFTLGRSAFGPYASAVVLYLCSLGACVGLYKLTRHRAWPASRPQSEGGTSQGWAMAAALGLGLWLSVPPYVDAIRTTVPQDHSDILMALTVYPQRWLAGQEVYVPLTAELGYFALPTYLPGTWFPFVVPELLQIDYRWVPGAVLGVALAVYFRLLYRQRLTARQLFALTLLPFALLYSVMITEPGVVGWTVELMIVGYYLLLVASILSPSYWGLAVMLILCLLSRFSLVFWVPLHLALLFFQQSRRVALGVTAAVAVGILVLYVVPFLSHDWGMFMRVQAAYTEVGLNEWNHLNAAGRPMHLFNGIGLGNFFYHHMHGPLLERLQALKTVQVTLLLLTVAGSAWLYWRQQAPRTDYRVFSVIVLKAYLTTFYAFVQVPYAYLATVGLFLSLYLAFIAARFGALPATDAPSGPVELGAKG
ncbi:MAG TPA: hypothetical protein VF629_14125 [Hymenobacter sp.]|jgi:hypothetical protein|uniref:hypothetical protein n=1 Tax=Hymenobacter sp. TaxID=1898978 RepID=UPI002ED9343F